MVKTAVQAKRRHIGMIDRGAVNRKFSDCQLSEPIQTLQGCHAQKLLVGLRQSFSLAITLSVERCSVVRLAI